MIEVKVSIGNAAGKLVPVWEGCNVRTPVGAGNVLSVHKDGGVTVALPGCVLQRFAAKDLFALDPMPEGDTPKQLGTFPPATVYLWTQWQPMQRAVKIGDVACTKLGNRRFVVACFGIEFSGTEVPYLMDGGARWYHADDCYLPESA